MHDPTILIATSVTLLYLLVGPLILLGIYVLFDSLSKPDSAPPGQRPDAAGNADPALWSSTQLQEYFSEQRYSNVTEPKVKGSKILESIITPS